MYTKEQEEYINETTQHLDLVINNMYKVIDNLENRLGYHDDSKFHEPEMSGFMAMTAEINGLENVEYGSPEYKAVLARHHDTTIGHHYAHNSDHPEHYSNGIAGMSCMDQIEMLCDWEAACHRMKNGSFTKSFEINVKRFNMTPEQESTLRKTAEELDFFKT